MKLKIKGEFIMKEQYTSPDFTLIKVDNLVTVGASGAIELPIIPVK